LRAIDFDLEAFVTSSRRPAARLALAAATAGLLVPALPALAGAGGGRTAAASAPVVGEIILCEDVKCDGTQDKDTIVGDQSTQRVVAGGGDDDIELDANFTSGSGDTGIGGEGRDCIDGGAGNDRMFGGPGDDNRPCEFSAFVDPQAAMTGGPGDDTIYGEAGNDSMNGIFDNDTLFGGTGDDLLRDTAARDKDRLFGEAGNDTLDARDGDTGDLIDGGTGNDSCSGDNGDSFVNCETITRV
jgi:Ca2+-binding RTX toxin-like protein